MYGKCPKCEKMITYLNLEPVDVHQGGRNAWRGVSYLCPFCQTVLGAGLDPVALKADTVNEVIAGLKR